MPLSQKKPTLSVKDFLNPKHSVLDISATPVFTVKLNDTVENVLEAVIWGSKRVLVRDRLGKFQGIITSKDMLDFLGGGHRKHLLYDSGLKTQVKELMDPDIHQLEMKTPVLHALNIFRKHGRDAHPITHKNKIAGLLSERDFIRNIVSPMGIPVSEVMTEKPFSIKDDTSISQAVQHLAKGGFSRLPVISQGKIIGIVSPYDILYNLGKTPKEIMKNESSVRTIMNRAVITTKPERDIHDAVNTMKRTKIGFLPVVENSEFIGIITERDILEI